MQIQHKQHSFPCNWNVNVTVFCLLRSIHCTGTDCILVEFCDLQIPYLNYPCIFRTFQDVKIFLRNRGRPEGWKLPLNSRGYKDIPKRESSCDLEPYFGMRKNQIQFSVVLQTSYMTLDTAPEAPSQLETQDFEI